MKWDYVKNIITVIVIISAVEALRYYTGLPFTVIDIIVSPLSIILLIFGIKSLLFNPLKKSQTQSIKLPALKLFGYLIAAVLLFILGLWALFEGWQNPLALYSGVKGAAHGYTLISLGIFILTFSGYLIYLFACKTIEIYTSKR